MLEDLPCCKLVVADTMNLWIQTERAELGKLLKRIHGLVLNDGEARLLTEQDNLIAAARDVLKMGPKFVVIKKGEHGCLMCSGKDTFVLPAFPAEKVVDPTGAGDSFAGGMMGYLATQNSLSSATIKRALAFGTIVASYTISDFNGVKKFVCCSPSTRTHLLHSSRTRAFFLSVHFSRSRFRSCTHAYVHLAYALGHALDAAVHVWLCSHPILSCRSLEAQARADSKKMIRFFLANADVKVVDKQQAEFTVIP
jgi:hypothetical protein